MVQIRTFLAYVVLSGLLAFTPTKIWGEESFRRFKEIYALILGIPAEESKDYCLFKLEGETVELYFIEVENEYSIIVVYTIL